MVVRHVKEDMAENIAQKIVDELEQHFQSQPIDFNGPYEAGIKKNTRYVSFVDYDSR